jgi:hypothetical protein
VSFFTNNVTLSKNYFTDKNYNNFVWR